MPKSFSILLTSISASLLISSLLTLSGISSPAFANEWRKDVPQAKLLGQGELTWFGFSIYKAKLWQESKTFNPDANFALEISYLRSISKQRFVDTSIDEIKRLYGQTITEETLQKWRTYMEKAFTDVKEGDQLIGVNISQYGCRFYSKEKLLAEVQDEKFSKAFFSIWFDPRTKDSRLRNSLLGNKD